MTHSKLLPPTRVEFEGKYLLRPVEPGDLLAIERGRAASLPFLHRFMEWSHHPTDRERFLERILVQWGNYFRGDEYEMALFDREGEFLVYTGFYPTVRINPRCYEIGYWTSALHANKGFATLATQMQIALIFEYLKGDRIEITVSIENHASLKVIEKCGFRYEGELRNFYPQGTEEMHNNGYIRERRVSLFSLIPEDRPQLPWYSSIVEKSLVVPLLEQPRPLSSYRSG